jgi:ammonium transporter, Amt family
MVTVLWMVLGYSLAFTDGNWFVGGLSRVFLNGLGADWDKPFTLGAGTSNALAMTIPESVFILFQMAFAIITPAVVIGAFADRMKFSALILFMALWSLAVYAPVAQWVWSATG